MNKMSKEKRSQVLLTVVIVAIIVTGLYMGLIRAQKTSISGLQQAKEKALKKLDQINATSKNGPQITLQLTELRKDLGSREDLMVSNDLYASAIKLIRDFKSEYPLVEIKQFIQKGSGNNNMFTKFPYRQFTLGIVGTGHYHEIGRFFADLENQFKGIQLVDLEITPESGTVPEDKEKLLFKLDILLPVKSSTTNSPAPKS